MPFQEAAEFFRPAACKQFHELSIFRVSVAQYYSHRCVFLTMIQDTKSVPIDAKTSYEVPAHLEFIRKVGSGAYGTVASFRDPQTGKAFHTPYIYYYLSRREVRGEEDSECV